MDNEAKSGAALWVMLSLREYTLPSYWNGLSAGRPLTRHGTPQKRGKRWEVLRRDWGGLMRRKVTVVSGGNRDANSEMLGRQRIRSLRNSTQPSFTNCSSPPAAPPPKPHFSFLFYTLIVGESSETGLHGHTIPRKSLKGNWAFQPTPLIPVTLPSS